MSLRLNPNVRPTWLLLALFARTVLPRFRHRFVCVCARATADPRVLLFVALFQKNGWAESDRELHVPISAAGYGAKTVSITSLTTLTDASGTFLSNPRVGSNKAEQWLEFVLLCIEEQVCLLLCLCAARWA
jgi:hypothetical protein